MSDRGSIVGAVVGGLAGVGIWVAMIVVTTGVCAIPILSTLWCTVPPIPGNAVSSTITLWDIFLLGVFIIIGATTGWKAR